MKKHKFREKIKKHKKFISGVCIFAICLGVAAAAGGTLKAPDSLKSNQDIPEHDGDVLVDSIHIEETAESSSPQKTKTENKSETKSKKDSQLVTSDDVSELDNADTYFEEMRATITMDRNEVISMLTDAENSAANTSEKESASQQKLKLLEYMEQEQNVENAIRAKGLPECLVLITDNGVNITVNKQELSQIDVAKICDVVMRETDKKAPEITVQSRY